MELVAFARGQFEIMRPAGGVPLREHLKSAARQSGRADRRLVAQCPAPLAHVWQWFGEMMPRRIPSFSGVSTLPHSEILAWCALRRIRINNAELDALLSLDDAFREVMSAGERGERSGN